MTRTFPDLLTLSRPTSPNTAFFAPEGVAPLAVVDGVVPAFEMPVGELAEKSVAIWQAQANVRLSEKVDDAVRRAHFVATTPLLRFKDDIFVEFLPLGEGASSFLIYSASRVGYSDLGTNRKRVESWIAQLKTQLKGA